MTCFTLNPLRFRSAGWAASLTPLGSLWSPSLAETTSPLPRFALKGEAGLCVR